MARKVSVRICRNTRRLGLQAPHSLTPCKICTRDMALETWLRDQPNSVSQSGSTTAKNERPPMARASLKNAIATIAHASHDTDGESGGAGCSPPPAARPPSITFVCVGSTSNRWRAALRGGSVARAPAARAPAVRFAAAARRC